MKIHFFTIVLNGMPYIEKHINTFNQLNFPWEWHIIEGLAELKNCSAWSLNTGGHIPKNLNKTTLSTDGTKEYIDELIVKHPNNIKVYRKDPGVLWNGKIEMIKAPLSNITEECLLWEVDSDEIWNSEQIETIRKAFIENPSKTAAWYWCNYYVGEDIQIITRNCYAQNPMQEWLRTWHFLPGDDWASHEPPKLVRANTSNQLHDVGKINPFNHNETEEMGAVFDHFSFVTEAQIRFKESYYGYSGAMQQWRRMNATLEKDKPELLSKYFSWVSDTTYVQKTHRDNCLNKTKSKFPMLLLDGVEFQKNNSSSICKLWMDFLKKSTKNGFSKYITVLDRGGTFPIIPGINIVQFPAWTGNINNLDSKQIDSECKKRSTEIFISTGSTYALKTPSIRIIKKSLLYNNILFILFLNASRTRISRLIGDINKYLEKNDFEERTILIRDLIMIFRKISKRILKITNQK